MPDDFPYDVLLSHSAKDKAVVHPLAERWRADAVQFASQPSTFNFQPTAAPLNKERRFLPLRLDDAPIKDSGWFRKDDDVRWQFGVPPKGNANFAWVQHFIHHLAPAGMAGFVLANGSMSSNQSSDCNARSASPMWATHSQGLGSQRDIRQKPIEADLVDCMDALPGQLFLARRSPCASGSR